MGKAILVCMPVKGTDAKDVVAGSFIKQCDECVADIWTTKASLAYSGGQILICMNCFHQKVGKEEIQVMEPSEGQLRELDDHFRKEDG